MRHFGLVIAIVVLLAVAFLGAAGTSSVSYAQSPVQTPSLLAGYRTVTVLGNGQASAQPDQAMVTLGVVTEAETASQALTLNNQQMQGLLSALQQAGIAPADIQTQAIQLQPRQSPPMPTDTSGQGTESVVTGYTAINTVQVRVRSLDQLGELIDTAVKAGANQVQGISFVISDPNELLAQAQQAAWQDARNQAEALAALAGGELGEVLHVRQTGISPLPYAAMAVAADMAAVPIAPGTSNVQTSVEVTWELRPGLEDGTGTPTPIVSPAVTVSPTLVLSPIATTSPTPIASPNETASPTLVASPTETASPTLVATSTGTALPTPLASPTPIASPTSVASPTEPGSPTSTASPTETFGTATTTATPSPTVVTVELGVLPTGTPLAAGGALPVTGWQRVTVPDLGIAFDMPEGWTNEGAEWTWSAPGLGAPRIGIDWQDTSPGWQPEQMLPPGSNIFVRDLELMGMVPATRFVIQAPVDDADPYAMPFQTHLIVPIGGRAYDAFAMARSREELASLDDVLATVVGSVRFTR